MLKLLISCALLASASAAPAAPAEAAAESAESAVQAIANSESCVMTHLTQESKFSSRTTIDALNACIEGKKNTAMADSQASGDATAALMPAQAAAKPPRDYAKMSEGFTAEMTKAMAKKAGVASVDSVHQEFIRAKLACLVNKDTCVFVTNFEELSAALNDPEVKTIIVEDGATVLYRNKLRASERVRLGQLLIIAPTAELFILKENVLLVFGEVKNFGVIRSADFEFNEVDSAIVLVGSALGQNVAETSFVNFGLVFTPAFAAFGVVTTRSPVTVTNHGELFTGITVLVGVALTSTAVELDNFGRFIVGELGMFSSTLHNRDGSFLGGLTDSEIGQLPNTVLAIGVFEGATQIKNAGEMIWDNAIVLGGDVLNSGELIFPEVFVNVLGNVINSGTIKIGFKQIGILPNSAIALLIGSTTFNTGEIIFAPRLILLTEAIFVVAGGTLTNKGEISGAAVFVTVCDRGLGLPPPITGDGITNKGHIEVSVALFLLAPRFGQTCFTNTREGQITLTGSRLPSIVSTLLTSPAVNILGQPVRGTQLDNQGKLSLTNGDVDHQGTITNEGIFLVKSGKLRTSDDENCKLKSTGLLLIDAPEE